MRQDDIISYIVTGRPASDNPLADQQGGGGVNASQVAIGQLAGNLGGAAGEELGFDVFQIRQEPDPRPHAHRRPVSRLAGVREPPAAAPDRRHRRAADRAGPPARASSWSTPSAAGCAATLRGGSLPAAC